ncbi:MAG: hypothetical protein F6K35_42320 [Okeania sp. SIO2H7]|nr:hypothetical protein [Okeania sp. SIO2H7]
MTQDRRKPRACDAVLGGESPPPISGAVLGGLEGVKRRLAFDAEEVKIAALSDAFNYGQAGKDLVEESWKNETGKVQRAAFDLLWEHGDEETQSELINSFLLQTESGVDYSKLQGFLQKKNWKKADIETRLALVRSAGLDGKFFNKEQWKLIPCRDLKTVSRLWDYYSQGHFGFKIQRQIYQELGGTTEREKEILERVGDRVGWKKNGKWLRLRSEFTWDKNAPQGHIPNSILGDGDIFKQGGKYRFFYLMQRCLDCDI